jgi:hypothetical protein
MQIVDWKFKATGFRNKFFLKASKIKSALPEQAQLFFFIFIFLAALLRKNLNIKILFAPMKTLTSCTGSHIEFYFGFPSLSLIDFLQCPSISHYCRCRKNPPTLTWSLCHTRLSELLPLSQKAASATIFKVPQLALWRGYCNDFLN